MTTNSTSTPLILAIDTSCDDTSAAVTAGVTVLSNIIASQTQLHQPYGGVFPTVAKQAHRENIDRTIAVALQRAGLEWSEVAALAVTQGPGLAPALEVGINKAKELAKLHQLPLIAVNHIEAHALSALAEPRRRQQQTATTPHHLATSWQQKLTQQQLPALAIVVSGGHTEFIKVIKPGKYERLGWTIDDAAGEALDKVGRMLDLGYPAGPVLEKFAKSGDAHRFNVPLPMTEQKDYQMSFSGLKTWARNTLESHEAKFGLNQQDIYDFAASFQRGVFRHICYKLNKLIADQKPTDQFREVWLGGGVAANMELRRMIRETLRTANGGLKLHVPYTKRLTMDNAAMIGVTAGYQFLQKDFVTDEAALERRPRWAVTA